MEKWETGRLRTGTYFLRHANSLCNVTVRNRSADNFYTLQGLNPLIILVL